MTFWGAAQDCFRWSARLVWTVPLLALVVLCLEGLQHLVEWRAGMYVSIAAAKAAEHDPARMAFGLAKVAGLTVLHYWTTRFIISGGSVQRTFASDPHAARKFAAYVAFALALAVTQLWLPVWMQAAGASQQQIVAAAAGALVVGLPLGTALAPWSVGAALGDPEAGPFNALRCAWGSILWGMALTLVVIGPVMVAHYVLGLGGIGQPPRVAAGMLVADTLLVGFLGILANCTPVFIAARMAGRRGVSLRLDGAAAR